MFDLERLLEESKLIEQVATDGIENEYNAVTQRVNNTITEGIDEYTTDAISSFKKNRNGVTNKFDLSDLESAVNEALSPSANITSTDAFKSTKPIKQSEFVKTNTLSKDSELNEYNTNTEHDITEHSSDMSVEKSAESVLKEKQDMANSNKKWDEVAKKQMVLKENSEKFVAFVESIKNDENADYLGAVLEAYQVTFSDFIK